MKARSFLQASIVGAGALIVTGCSGRGGHDAGPGDDVAAAGPSSGVQLRPNPAYASAAIVAVFDDPLLNAAPCTFEWRRNGDVIPGAESDGLDPSQFSRGDEIEVAVRAQDPGGATRRLAAKVRVQNTPPAVTNVYLDLSNDSGEPLLAAVVESADPDHDATENQYRWFRNGSPIVGESGATLALSRVQPGDRVEVEVVARDESSASLPMRSNEFSLANRPPGFSSQPNAPRAADTVFRYQAAAMDPDGDPLRFELVRGPEGMTVDTVGLVEWALPDGPTRQGDFPVQLRATDSRGGEATQDFTIHLGPAPGQG